jgi:hypothetical protein
MHFEGACWREKSYHLQVVLVLESPATRFAVVLVVILVLHVLIRLILSVEFLPACLTGDSRCPMSKSRHMLVRCSLGTKGTGAGLTFGPVVIVLHVLFAVISAPESGCAGLALVHFGQYYSK